MVVMFAPGQLSVYTLTIKSQRHHGKVELLIRSDVADPCGEGCSGISAGALCSSHSLLFHAVHTNAGPESSHMSARTPLLLLVHLSLDNCTACAESPDMK